MPQPAGSIPQPVHPDSLRPLSTPGFPFLSHSAVFLWWRPRTCSCLQSDSMCDYYCLFLSFALFPVNLFKCHFSLPPHTFRPFPMPLGMFPVLPHCLPGSACSQFCPRGRRTGLPAPDSEPASAIFKSALNPLLDMMSIQWAGPLLPSL